MREEIKNKLDQVYESLMERPREILEVFNNHFGEEHVDFQDYPSIEDFYVRLTEIYTEDQILYKEPKTFARSQFDKMFILVRLPEVRVTNENDRYIDIWELFIKVSVTTAGKTLGAFELNRAKYDMLQLKGNYLHSHVRAIPFDNFKNFTTTCLGDGPIKGTIASLVEDFDILRWQLYCLELDKYVRVESLSGGPFKNLENLHKNALMPDTTNYSMKGNSLTQYLGSDCVSLISSFISWLISSNKLTFNYVGAYSIAMSYLNWQIFVSNEFIEWYNNLIITGNAQISYDTLLNNSILRRRVIKNNKIYKESNSATRNFSSFIGEEVCKFKGEIVRLSIINSEQNIDNSVLLLDTKITEQILMVILKVLNYESGNNNSTEAQITGARETVKYF